MARQWLTREDMVTSFDNGVTSISFDGDTYVTAAGLPSVSALGSLQYVCEVVEPIGGTISVTNLNVGDVTLVDGAAPLRKQTVNAAHEALVKDTDVAAALTDVATETTLLAAKGILDTIATNTSSEASAQVEGQAGPGDDPGGFPLYLVKDPNDKVAILSVNNDGHLIVADPTLAAGLQGRTAEGDIPSSANPFTGAGIIGAPLNGGLSLDQGKVHSTYVLVDGTTVVGSAQLPLALGPQDPTGSLSTVVQGPDNPGADAPPTGFPLWMGFTNSDGFFRGVGDPNTPLPVFDQAIIYAIGSIADPAYDPAADPPTSSTGIALLKAIQNVIGDVGSDGQINTLVATVASRLPTSLGAKAGVASLSIVPATDAVFPTGVNTEIVVLASGAQTGTYTGADLTNPGARGVAVTFDVTAVPLVTTVTLSIQVKDLASGKYTTILTGTALAVTGTNRYMVCPGITPVTNQAANDVIPRVWRVLVTHSTTGSFTYSIGAAYIA